jgi:hypothetical protein
LAAVVQEDDSMKSNYRRARINEMLDHVHKQLSNVRADLKNNSMPKNDLWDAYTKLEYAILLVKLDHGFETAGGFEYSKFGKTNDMEMLELAIDCLESGKKALNKGTIKSAINDLRRARDALKLLLKR